ncbi:hypothetical protein ID858_15120 [Xenorhabdus sp. DI]|uniref:hypothetical protein n=1 Tax=Xenorhabdus doucetiae TaxID=351671 RepID=UPI0019AB3150|nr:MULTISPECIES: hypothetical protein [unclassified Xenorhabdus]MBD2786305.1 hypothetical protein [Xenorhabdus sp. 3]MBD2789831.1 hypothetical protein [Xenorhabdus sp. DI]
MTIDQAPLNEVQQKLKEELTYQILFRELIIYLDITNPKFEPSRFMEQKLQGILDLLPQTAAINDPSVKQAYEEALSVVKGAVKERKKLTAGRDQK